MTNVKLVFHTPDASRSPGSGESRGVQAQLALGLSVCSLAPALRHGITRGVL